MNFVFSHWPAFIEAVACGMWRASAISSAIACSAVVIVLPPGVFITTMPRAVAAGTSTLSTPIPARPITRSSWPAAITSAVTFVPLRITSASASAIAVEQLAGRDPGPIVDLDAARAFEDLEPLAGELIRYENLGHGLPLRCAAARSCVARRSGARGTPVGPDRRKRSAPSSGSPAHGSGAAWAPLRRTTSALKPRQK